MFTPQLYKTILLLFVTGVPLWFLLRSFFRHQAGIGNTLLQLGFFMYCLTVLAVTVVPLPFARHKSAAAQGINLVPLRNNYIIVQNVIHANKEFLLPHLMQNILGNIVLFMPLGLLLRWVAGQRFTLYTVLLTGFFASMSIEIIQWIERRYGIYRSVDIDDVILNTTGTLLGWWLFLLVRKAAGSRSNQNNHA